MPNVPGPRERPSPARPSTVPTGPPRVTDVWPQLFESFIQQPAAASWLLSSSADEGPLPGALVADRPPPGLRIELYDPVPVVLSNGRNDIDLETRRIGAFFENGSSYVVAPLSEAGHLVCGVLLGNIVPPTESTRAILLTKWAADTRYSVLFKTTWFADGCFSAAVLRWEQPTIWIEEMCLFESINNALLGHRAFEVVRFIDRRDCPSCSQEKVVCEHTNVPTSLNGVFDGKSLNHYAGGAVPGVTVSAAQFVGTFVGARTGQYFGYSETTRANTLFRAFMRKFISPQSFGEEHNRISDLIALDPSWCSLSGGTDEGTSPPGSTSGTNPPPSYIGSNSADDGTPPLSDGSSSPQERTPPLSNSTPMSSEGTPSPSEGTPPPDGLSSPSPEGSASPTEGTSVLSGNAPFHRRP